MAENKNPYIPNGSTPIKNEILFNIIAKGLLSYSEIRIAMYIIYKSWRYIDAQKRRRQDWTVPLKLSQIANDIGMKYPLLHRTVKKMIKRKVLLRDENRYQFNEHYEQYITKSDITKSDTNITKSDTNITKSDIIPLRNPDEHKQGFPLNKSINKSINKREISSTEIQILKELKNIKIYPFNESKDISLIRRIFETREISKEEFLDVVESFVLYCEGPYKNKKKKNPRATFKNFFRDFPFKKQEKGGFYDAAGRPIGS